MKTNLNKSLKSLAAVVLLFGIWQGASLLLQKNMLPSPLTVLEKIPFLIEKQGISGHLQASFYRVCLGLLFSILGGFAIGLAMGRFKKAAPFSDALIYLTYPIPKMALLPIVMLLGGLGDTSKIVMIMLIVLPQVTIAVRDAVRDIPQNYYDIYHTLQAKKTTIFLAVTLPSTLPAVFSSLRVSLGTALSILFFTENYGTEYGMGYFIMDAWTRMDYPAMYGGILILAACGFFLFLLIDIFNHFLFKWQR